MNKIIFGLIFTLLLASCQCEKNKETVGLELSDSEHLVISTAWFQKSAEMRACYYQAFNLASLRIRMELSEKQSKKSLAVILDIDETIIDNSPFEVHLINTGQLYSSQLWKEWTDKEQANALPGALEFTILAKNRGVEVFYISNRKVNELESTIRNMKQLGFPNAEPKYIQLKSDKSDKTVRRSQVTDKYEVVLYIGDNLTDFDQVFAHRDSTLGSDLVDKYKSDFGSRFIILPNPMYGEWEGALYENNYKLSAMDKSKLRKSALDGY